MAKIVGQHIDMLASDPSILEAHWFVSLHLALLRYEAREGGGTVQTDRIYFYLIIAQLGRVRKQHLTQTNHDYSGVNAHVRIR
jgi:hypothetical protein